MNFNRKNIMTFMMMLIVSIYSTGCASQQTKKSMPDNVVDRPIKGISQATAAKLMVDGKLPAVVFSIDKKGAVQSYKINGNGTYLPSPSFPLRAGNITSIETITIFETSNPKTCWLTTSGATRCISW